MDANMDPRVIGAIVIGVALVVRRRGEEELKERPT